MITSYPIDSIEVLQIKQAVESRLGSKPNSPADFAELSLHIKLATGKEISTDTLSRIWGYKKGYSSVRQSTIKILDAFGRGDSESDFIYSVAVKTEEMPVGGQVRIAWLPDRVCVLSYLGDYRWRVEEAVNSKLHAGDTFSCRTIAQDQALIVDHLHTRDADYEGYAIGGKNGLTLVAKI